MEIDILTHKVIGCAYKVHNVLGSGFLEKVYENALTLEIRKQGMDVRQQVKLPVWYDGYRVGLYFPDLWIEGRLIVATGIHSDIENERGAIPERIEERVEIGNVHASGIPGLNRDVRDAVEDGRYRAVSHLRAAARQVLLPHAAVPIDRVIWHVGSQCRASVRQDDMLIVQSAEHFLDDHHELRFGGSGDARREFGPERVPVDALVIEIRVDPIECRPQLVELRDDLGWSGRSRRLTAVAPACRRHRERGGDQGAAGSVGDASGP